MDKIQFWRKQNEFYHFLGVSTQLRRKQNRSPSDSGSGDLRGRSPRKQNRSPPGCGIRGSEIRGLRIRELRLAQAKSVIADLCAL